MSGILSDKREAQIGKFLDGAIDFDALFQNQKKVFGIINLGRFIEKRDRKLFTAMVHMLDDHLIAANPTPEKVAAVENALLLLEKRDVNGFIDHVAGILSGAIDIPFTTFEKQIFQGVLMLFSGLITKTLDKAETILSKAETEE